MKAFENKNAVQMEEWLDGWRTAIREGQFSGFALSKNLLNGTYHAKEFGAKVVYDNNSEFHDKEIKGFSLASPDTIKQGEKIIIFSDRGYENIKQLLLSKGLAEFDDFALWRDLVPLMKLAKKQKLHLPIVHVAVTTKCTLECAKCNMLIPQHKAVKTDVIMDLADLQRDIDLFFALVDWCEELDVLGGEPLLHPQLSEYLEYAARYRERIGRLIVTTNGTVMPNRQVLETCKKNNIHIQVSNYSLTGTDDYKRKRAEVLQLAGRNNLLYGEIPMATAWSDFFAMGEGSSRHFHRCSPCFRGLNDGRFYSCHLVWSADKCGFVKASPDDYLELGNFGGDAQAKWAMLKHDMGFHRTGFPDLCKVCGGCDPYFFKPIKAGEQKGQGDK